VAAHKKACARPGPWTRHSRRIRCPTRKVGEFSQGFVQHLHVGLIERVQTAALTHAQRALRPTVAEGEPNRDGSRQCLVMHGSPCSRSTATFPESLARLTNFFAAAHLSPLKSARPTPFDGPAGRGPTFRISPGNHSPLRRLRRSLTAHECSTQRRSRERELASESQAHARRPIGQRMALPGLLESALRQTDDCLSLHSRSRCWSKRCARTRPSIALSSRLGGRQLLSR
jgi:hypothetical protein